MANNYNKAPSRCPICGEGLKIEVVSCDNCKTKLMNSFGFSVFDRLNEEQKEFVLSFIKHEGIIKDMEKEFKVSYPTIKLRLAEINRLLARPDKEDSLMQALDELQSGTISLEEAAEKIKRR